jgi:fructose-bisphosphate aldolase class II
VECANVSYRLEAIQKKSEGRVEIVLHGTNGFPPDIMQKCISYGVTRVNVNKLVMNPYFDWTEKEVGKKPLTNLVSEGTDLIQKMCEEWMDHIGSSGKA